MIVRLMPHPDQIRWYANSGLAGFETLSPEQAAEGARDGLQGILDYLDALEASDDAVFELGSEAIKGAGSLELRACRSQIDD
ncbi:MAG: hypothetical protein SGJ21_09160 [Alphaproteobacteria bacterium]|nr:hypothetical protein [Alphaproteobacteria bacterium]